MEWYSITELSEKLSIPDATIRRYVRQHSHHLQVRKKHKSYQIAKESVPVLTKIREFYAAAGMTVDQVDEALAAAHVPIIMTVDDVNDHGESVAINIPEALSSLRNVVIDRMNEQEKRISTLLDHIQRLEVTLKSQVLLDPKHGRNERLNERLTERKIERQLETEALDYWGKKPESERLKKAGWFKREENTAARTRFIRDYVDQHYEDRIRMELTKELDLESRSTSQDQYGL